MAALPSASALATGPEPPPSGLLPPEPDASATPSSSSSPAGSAGAVPEGTYRRWEPLPRIQYGFAVAPFVPEADSLNILVDNGMDPAEAFAAVQPHLIGLEVGDEVYVFEQLGHTDISWYRGYVVSTNRVPTTATSTSSLSDYSTFPSTSSTGATLVEEPQVYVGIFPRANVYFREELDDAEMRLAEVYERARDAGIVGATGPPPPHAIKSAIPSASSHMETLPEEDENVPSNPASPSMPDSKQIATIGDVSTSSAGAASAAGAGGKVTFDSSRHSFVLQDAQADEQRPPPPLPSLKCGDETVTGAAEPLVDEIACALREWSTLMYAYLGRRDYALFQIVREHVEVLHAARKQFLAQTLSEEESARLRRECVARLVMGNVQQGLDVIVRHPGRGGLVDVDFTGKESDPQSWISGIRLYALQCALAYIDQDSNAASGSGNGVDPMRSITIPSSVLGIMSQSITSAGNAQVSRGGRHGRQTPLSSIGWPDRGGTSVRNSVATPKPDATSDIKYYHVFLDVRNFAASPCQFGETTELYFSLYNRAEARFLTEEFCVLLNHQGAPLQDGKLGKLRTLFTDLSVNDMHDLNVVCRIVRNGAMKLPSIDSHKNADTTQATGHGTGGLQDHADRAENTPGFRLSRMATDKTFRRPFGCAVVELGREHSLTADGQSSSPLREHTMPIFVSANEAAFSTLHQDIIASRVREIAKSPRADLLSVGVKVWHGDKDVLVRENPSLLQDVAQTARLGFPDVVFPGDTRNEVYVKLWSGDFYPQSSKVSVGNTSKNVQVSVEVRTRDGSVLEGAISRGTGESPVSQFDSMVFYHQNAPTWGELMKLQLPNDVIEHCHLFFTFRYRSAKEDRALQVTPAGLGTSSSSSHTVSQPFAHAYLPLFEANSAFIADGSHTLLLWRSSRSAQHLSPELYFTLPAMTPVGQSLGDIIPASLINVIQPLRDTMTLRTFLVSAKYTQNEVLLKLLNWEQVLSQSAEDLKAVLMKLAFVGEVEIVKFLRNIFDALFGIIVSPKNGTGDLDDLVFKSLVTVLGIVQDRRFSNFRATLDVYIEQHYHSQTAHTRLMASLAKLLADPARTETSKELRAAIKVWPYIFKFIVRSRENQRGVKEPLGALGGAVSDHFETSFKRDLDALLRSINRLMSTTKPSSIIGTQTLALQNFADILPELSRVFPLEELARIETAFADSVFATNGRMAVWKLLHILHVSHDALMDDHASRSQMLPSIVRWVRPHIGKYDESANTNSTDHDSARDTTRVVWVEAARLGVAIIAVILDKLQISLVNGRKGNITSAEMRQEQDNVDYVLSMMPKLLETYKELDSAATKLAIERHRSPSTVMSSVPVIFPSSYPFPLLARKPAGHPAAVAPPRTLRRNQRHGQNNVLNCGLGEIAAVLIVLVMLSPRRHLSGFLDEQLDVEGREKQSELLHNFFDVGTSILLNEAFPSTWLNINILSHQMILKMADPLATLLVREYIPSADKTETFDTDLWRAGFSMLLTLLSSEQLVIERFKPQRRRAVWRLAGDVRGEGAQIFAKLWNSIGWPDQQKPEQETDVLDLSRLNTGGFQVQFVPSLVEPVLELCLSHHDELRTCAVRVLATMITSEWHLNGDFAVIEAEIIDKLDVLFIADTQGDEISRAFFIGQLRSLFESPQVDPMLQEQVHACLVSVNRFLDLLLSVRSLPLEEGFEDDRVSGTLKLLGFLRQANRVSAFSTHVLRLVNLHLENQSYVEAALTLKLHADLHTWEMDSFVEPIADLDLPKQSHFARKETLYMLILDYLNKGQAWEISIDICRELAREYEYHAVDYSRLADVLTLQASLFQKIGTEERVFPNYFRVAYYGSQWPNSLQGKNFIYRGNSWEKFSNFCERMHQRHPRATLIKSAMEPNDEIRFSSNMFLQIMAVQPEPDRTKDVFVNSETPPIVRAYYENNTTNLFSFTRPIVKKEKDGETSDPSKAQEKALASLWVEKTYLRVEDSFPTVLRRSEIAEIEVVRISPIENALLDVENKVKELETLEVKFLSLSKVVGSRVSLNTNRLSMALNGAVDAPVNGGIPMYKRAFFSTAYVSEHPTEEPVLHKLRGAIDRQATVIYRCIVLHNRLCPPEMRPFHETLARFFQQNFADEIVRLQLDIKALAREHDVPEDLDDDQTTLDGSLSRQPSVSIINRQASGGLRATAGNNDLGLSPTPSAATISPLQRHIAYLSTQTQPIKASPTALDHTAARSNAAVAGQASSASLQRAPTTTGRSMMGGGDTASVTNTLTGSALRSSVSVPLGMSSISGIVHGQNGSSGNVTATPTATSAAPPEFQNGGSGSGTGNAVPSLKSEKSSFGRRHGSLMSKVTEGRDRASRLFSSTGNNTAASRRRP